MAQRLVCNAFVPFSSSTAPSNFPFSKLRKDSSPDKYESWKEAMLAILESSDGDLSQPLEKNNHAYEGWKSKDVAVKERIVDALSDELHPEVVEIPTAREVWLHLEGRFTPHDQTTASSPAPQLQEHKQMPLALYRAALGGNWDETKAILDADSEMAKASSFPILYTALHIAVGTGKTIPYLKELVNYYSAHDLLALRDAHNKTALHMAALMGNLPAARILVGIRRDLLYMTDIWGQFPVVNAALSGHCPTVEFFIDETIDDHWDSRPHAAVNGPLLLNTLIESAFFDYALKLIDKSPHLAKIRDAAGHSALRTLALKHYAFASGARLKWWERLIYSTSSPLVKRIRDQKVMHQQAHKLLKRLCKEMESLSETEAASIYVDAMLKAAELGIPEVIEGIVEIFPIAVYAAEPRTKRYFLHIAVENRCEKVFNLVYQMSGHSYQFSNIKDISGNTLTHLVAKLAPSHKLNMVSGAALQMQRELQWFREVEKNVRHLDREQPNYDGRTPKMIFTEEHSNLKVEGERWMKDTANSCSIAAALIATVVFAAAITVPGGNAESGFPLFARSSAFIMFAISDAVSLFTSTTSLLMFLAILTSRYAEEDFLHALPKRLCVGLFTLFLSILSMMVAFSCTIYLVFGKMSGWVIIPVAVLACLPVTSFVLLQFPLLVDVVSSTYGRGIFGKQSDRPFH